MEHEQTPNRIGETIITSVSVSKEFNKLVKLYDLSPTECFRRGMAVTLFDLGVEMYQSPKNKERSAYMKEFLGRIAAEEKIKKEYKRVRLFEEIQKHFKEIQKIADDISSPKEEISK